MPLTSLIQMPALPWSLPEYFSQKFCLLCFLIVLFTYPMESHMFCLVHSCGVSDFLHNYIPHKTVHLVHAKWSISLWFWIDSVFFIHLVYKVLFPFFWKVVKHPLESQCAAEYRKTSKTLGLRECLFKSLLYQAGNMRSCLFLFSGVRDKSPKMGEAGVTSHGYGARAVGTEQPRWTTR